MLSMQEQRRNTGVGSYAWLYEAQEIILLETCGRRPWVIFFKIPPNWGI